MIFRRNSRRLPGTLCDETPGDASFHSRCATCAMPISFGFQPPSRTKADARWVHDGPPADGHQAVRYGAPSPQAANAGRWQPRIPVHEVDEPRDDGEYDRARTVAEFIEDMRHVQPAASPDGPLTAYLRHLLDEITADRDQLSAANGLLVAKVRELREQLAVPRA